jgi:conjugative transfer region protein TrbK
MRTLTARGWGTLGAVLVFVAVVLATAATLSQKPGLRPANFAETALANDVARCSHQGGEAENDPACREAWRQSRARFLGLSSGAKP